MKMIEFPEYVAVYGIKNNSKIKEKTFNIYEIVATGNHNFFLCFLRLAYGTIIENEYITFTDLYCGKLFTDYSIRAANDININLFIMDSFLDNKIFMSRWADFLNKKFPDYRLIVAEQEIKKYIILFSRV